MNKKYKIFIGVDYGLKKIGFSIGNNLTKIARPLKIINYINDNKLLIEINNIINFWDVKYFIIGLPFFKNNKKMINNKCILFFKKVKNQFNIKIKFINENYSSIILNNKNKYIDDISAAIILQQYFNDI